MFMKKAPLDIKQGTRHMTLDSVFCSLTTEIG